jgi:hypothetical protein
MNPTAGVTAKEFTQPGYQMAKPQTSTLPDEVHIGTGAKDPGTVWMDPKSYKGLPMPKVVAKPRQASPLSGRQTPKPGGGA